MTTYFISIGIAGLFILIAALISNMIKYQGGSNPKDPMQRKIAFWICALVNPIMFYVIAGIVMVPSKKVEQMKWNDSIPIALAIGIVAYIVIGFLLSKVFKNGKLGNWF